MLGIAPHNGLWLCCMHVDVVNVAQNKQPKGEDVL